MATDDERMFVRIEAQLRQFERDMARASGMADRTAGRIERRFRTMERNLVGVGRGLASSLAPFVGTFAGGTLFTAIRRAVAEVDALGDAADKAGVSGESLQILRRLLQDTAGNAEDADAGLQKFAKTVGELAVTGNGPAKDAFEALGISIRDSAGDLKTQEQLFREVAAVFPRIATESQAAAIAARLFGREAGSALAVALRGGVEALDATEAKLRSTNSLLSQDAIDAADKFERRFTEMADRWDSAWKRMALAAAEALYEIGRVEHDIINSLQNALDPSRVEQGAAAGITAGQIIGEAFNNGDLVAGGAGASSSNIDRAFAAADSMRENTDLQVALERAIHGTIDARIDDTEATGGQTAAMRSQRDVVGELIADLDFERSLIGLSATEQRVLTEQRRAGAEATDQERAAIAEKVRAIETELARQEALTARLEETRDLARDVAGSIVDIFKDGKVSADEFADALARIADRLLDLSLDNIFGVGGSGGGLFAGLFNSIFGSALPGAGAALGAVASPALSVPALNIPSPMGMGSANSKAGPVPVVEVRVVSGEMFGATVSTISGRVSAKLIHQNNGRIPGMLSDRQMRTS